MVEVVKMEPGIAAEVRGVTLNRISDDEFAVLYRAFLDNNVIVVRGQELSIEEFLAYSARFGVPKPHISRKTRHPDYPELTVMGVNARRPDGAIDQTVRSRGTGWHTDTPYEAEPAKATQLYGIEIPTEGGDTLFANMYAAYDALPERLKERIAPLSARYSYGGRTRQGIDLLDPVDQQRAPVTHRLVNTHPETGRKSLYVNPIHILGVVDLPEAESDALLEELFTYMLQPGCEYRHRWQKGDVVIWDNRCSLHAAAPGGYPVDQKRVHWRTTIMEPGYYERHSRAA
jgi:taurine dioxygenase